MLLAYQNQEVIPSFLSKCVIKEKNSNINAFRTLFELFYYKNDVFYKEFLVKVLKNHT